MNARRPSNCLRIVGAAVAASLVACAPVYRTERIDETVIGERLDTSVPTSTRLAGEVSAREDGLRVVVNVTQQCRRQRIQRVDRVRHVKRDVDDFALSMLYSGALLFGGGGAFLIADNSSHRDDPESRIFDSQIEPDAMAKIGYGIAGTGGVLLIVSVIDSLRARDGQSSLGEKEVKEGPPQVVSCGETSPGGIQISLVTQALEETGRAASESLVTPLGTTDRRGILVAPWTAIPATLLAGPTWPRVGTIVARAHEGDAQRLGEISLALPRRQAAARAWDQARRVDTAAGYERLLERFPEPAGGRAQARLRALLVQRGREALGRGDLEATRNLVSKLESLGEDPDVTALAHDLSQAVTAREREEAWSAVEAAVARTEAQDADAEVFAQVSQELKDAATQHPDEAREEELRARLSAAARAAARRLVDRARQAGEAGDYDEARELLAEAEAVSDQPLDEAEAIASHLNAAEARSLARSARALERRREYSEALAALTHAAELAPDDRHIARLRKRVERKLARARRRREASQSRSVSRSHEEPVAAAAHAGADSEPVASHETDGAAKAPGPGAVGADKEPPPDREQRIASQNTDSRPADKAPSETTSAGATGSEGAQRHEPATARVTVALPGGTGRSLVRLFDRLRLPGRCLGRYERAAGQFVAQFQCAAKTFQVELDERRMRLTCDDAECEECLAEARTMVAPLKSSNTMEVQRCEAR